MKAKKCCLLQASGACEQVIHCFGAKLKKATKLLTIKHEWSQPLNRAYWMPPIQILILVLILNLIFLLYLFNVPRNVCHNILASQPLSCVVLIYSVKPEGKHNRVKHIVTIIIKSAPWKLDWLTFSIFHENTLNVWSDILWSYSFHATWWWHLFGNYIQLLTAAPFISMMQLLEKHSFSFVAVSDVYGCQQHSFAIFFDFYIHFTNDIVAMKDKRPKNSSFCWTVMHYLHVFFPSIRTKFTLKQNILLRWWNVLRNIDRPTKWKMSLRLFILRNKSHGLLCITKFLAQRTFL